MGEIVVGGERFPILGPSRLWTETGLEVKPGQGARKRKDEIDLVVWHWTGGENGAEVLFSVLKARELGVEFFIDERGVVWQFCDPLAVDTFDAGKVNRRSIGIEIECYGFRSEAVDIPAEGRGRPTYSTILHGRPYVFAHFWPAQIAAAVSLADALSASLEIERAVPRGATGFVEASALSAGRLEAFEGHVGHFHVTERKIDPGLDLLEALRCSFSSEL